MGREQHFGFRTSAEERAAIAALAKRLERTESDAVRHVVMAVARELGAVEASEAGNEQRAK